MRGSFSIKLNDAKLFVVGMCIVLVAEIFLDASWKRYPCLLKYRLPMITTGNSYFGSETEHKDPGYNRTSWNSMRITLRAIYDARGDNMYFLKAGQNDYIIMENLRYMLLSENPDEPFIVGHVHNPSDQIANISGSAGYVISRQALRLIVTKGLDEQPACAAQDAIEDVQISK
ncbi:unnamed protein product [Echinostoma caproni]|uniref:N-acetylgalactosaminide beta-1,3-galactosyltransferase n=1 Tax=Echinostoma caproni TaxID=27848 RepID=A0A183BBJ8_9TREM|nr:unnamed protein product [Echinostoma caproni]